MKCIVCLTDDNLNTHMKVEVDDELYQVHLCDEHAETTTMGQVTKKVKEIKDKLKNAVKLAIDLGISIPEININNQSGTVGKMPDMDILPQETIPTPTSSLPRKEPAGGGAKKIVREAVEVKLSEEEKISCDTEIEMQEVEVKGGKVEIPKHTVGEAGESSIKIINTKDDVLQRRFKELKQIGDSGGQVPTGYLSDCLACQGTGIHPVLKKDCPKCGGTGMRA